MSETLANLLQETRQFPPPAELAANANVTADGLRRGRRRPARPSGRQQARRLHWAQGVGPGARLVEPAVREVVRRRPAQRRVQLPRPARRGRPRRQGRDPLGGRAGRHPHASPTPTCTRSVCQAANALTDLGVTRRRPGRDLHADDPRGRGRDAGLRPDRRHAQRGLRRLLRRRAVRPHPGRRRQARDHRRRRLPARQAVARSSRPSTRRSRECPSVEHVLVVRRTGQDVAWSDGRDVWWHDDGRAGQHRAQGAAVRRRAPAVHPLHHRHDGEAEGHPAHHRRLPDPGRRTPTTPSSTSSRRPTSTGAPPTSAGSPGTRYIVYGPLSNGATQVMYEGTPGHPAPGPVLGARREVQGHASSTPRRPRSARSMKWGDDIPAKFDLSSLRLLGSVGEPINPEAWMWYREHIGGDRCPIVDTWWQTETGAIMISPLPGVTDAQARLGDDARCPASPPTWSTTQAPVGAERRRRLPGAARAVAVDAAHDLGRRPAVHRHVLVALRGRRRHRRRLDLLRRRRRQAGRRRRPVAARPGRRRDARLRPQHLHHRGRVGAGVATRRWPRRRWSARPTRPPARRSSRSPSCAATWTPRATPARR